LLSHAEGISKLAAARLATWLQEGALMITADTSYFLTGGAAMYLLMAALWKFFWS
jgi:hypothetical protein